MSREFVERRNESFQRGESPEAIRSHYPALRLEQVYGAITFYLGNQKDAGSDIARNASAKRMLSLQPIQRLPKSG